MLGVVFYNSISSCNPQGDIYYFKFSLCYLKHKPQVSHKGRLYLANAVFKMKNLQ